ncbi:hypothetical protein MRQ36_22800 [Micromonospora sp. R77]|uniref:hypothetical protein n=1 Tax=Micromonospora sp. R77 TaxID=2925836 RepID=UPI001F606DD4|nr:hypothetical protein [Micromonospora sp. R77]MCI4065239.1 hypothetical protein [Micromonospora sp. R77]
MVAAHLRIAPLDPTRALPPRALRDLIHAHATPADRLEHIRIRAGPQGFDVMAFIDGDDPVSAAEILSRVVSLAISREPLLSLWRIL